MRWGARLARRNRLHWSPELAESAHGRMSDDRWLAFVRSAMHEAPIYIDETGGLGPANLRARARRLARQYGAARSAGHRATSQLMSRQPAG